MNCRECNLVLDSHAPEALTSAQRAAVDAHLASCEDCRADWANWRNIAALAIPPTTPELRARIAALLPAATARTASTARRPGRVFVIGGLLLAVVALAATLALRPADESHLAADSTSSPTPPTSGETPPVPQSTPTGADPIVTVQEGSTPSNANIEAGAIFEGGLDPRTVVIVERPEPIAGAVERAEGAKCHDAIVERLQGIVGLNFIAGARVSPFNDSDMDDWAIARQLGAGYLLVVSTNNGCNAYLHDSRTSDSMATVTGLMYGGAAFPPADSWSDFSASVAREIGDFLLRNLSTRVIEAQARVLDTTLSDGERIYALYDLMDRGKPIPGAFDSGVVAAAAQIGLGSSYASVRAGAWANLRRVDDSYLVGPLLQSLANDPDEDVRHQAALTLNTFLDEPGVRDALLRAAAEDPSQVPTVACCIPTVREAAEWASVATEDLPGWALGKLLDENLPARSRLFWISSGSADGRFVLPGSLGDAAQPVIFDIGRNETDPRVRQMAWNALDGADHPEFLPVLLDDLRNHPDEYVRSSAATALSPYYDLPEVRAAFEAAANDPSMDVRRMVGYRTGRTVP